MGHSPRLGLITSQAYSLVNFRRELIAALVARGISVFALAPDFTESSRNDLRLLGAVPVDYTLARATVSPVHDLLALGRLVRLLRQLKLDATLAYFIKPVIYGTLGAWLAGIPCRFALIEGAGFVFSEGGSRPFRRNALRELVIRMYRMSLKHAHRTLFLNPDDVELFVSHRMVDPNRARLIGGIGVDLKHWGFAPPVLDPPVFVLIARLLREKGVMDFVAAATTVKVTRPDVSFLLVGGIDENPGSLTESEVLEWHGRGIIQWTGSVQDVRPWLTQASVFVLPSYYREGIPRSIQEAMAMGRAIITTDTPGCRETVVPGLNGFLVPPKDPVALANAMMHFINNPPLISEMGVESRRLAETRFDVKAANQRIFSAIGIG